MIRTSLLSTVVVSMVTLLADETAAQFSFGVTQQNGVVTGGGLRVGGIVTPGRTGVRLGVSAGASHLVGIDTFKVRNGRNGRRNRGIANNRRQGRSTPEQFVKTAGRFDLDRDDRLDQEELAKVGAAVLAELRQRQGKKKRSSSRSRRKAPRKSGSSEPSTEEMVAAFVERCLKFDTDKDEALNAAETKRMATALIRWLS